MTAGGSDLFLASPAQTYMLPSRKKAYYGHTMRKQGNCLEKEIMQGTMRTRRGRPRTAWIDNIKSWTGLSVEESIRMTEEMEKVRPWCGQPSDRGRLRNRTEQCNGPPAESSQSTQHQSGIRSILAELELTDVPTAYPN